MKELRAEDVHYFLQERAKFGLPEYIPTNRELMVQRRVSAFFIFIFSDCVLMMSKVLSDAIMRIHAIDPIPFLQVLALATKGTSLKVKEAYTRAVKENNVSTKAVLEPFVNQVENIHDQVEFISSALIDAVVEIGPEMDAGLELASEFSEKSFSNLFQLYRPDYPFMKDLPPPLSPSSSSYSFSSTEALYGSSSSSFLETPDSGLEADVEISASDSVS